MKVSKTLLCSSEFPRASETISSKFIENLGKRPHNVSSTLPQGDPETTIIIKTHVWNIHRQGSEPLAHQKGGGGFRAAGPPQSEI
jgi:hypothetical protein